MTRVDRRSADRSSRRTPLARPATRTGALGYLAARAARVRAAAAAPRPGKVAADTKQYLYLDPGRLLGAGARRCGTRTSAWARSPTRTSATCSRWGRTTGCSTRLGVPDWVAQRLWLGSLAVLRGRSACSTCCARSALRGPGVVVAALAYMFTPYSLDYAARISVLLMPWAALPLDDRAHASRRCATAGWRYPAIFALVVQVVGGVNATALIFAGVGPVLWIVYAWLVAGEVQLRGARSASTAKIGVLTLAHVAVVDRRALRVQGGYGLDILKYTETVEGGRRARRRRTRCCAGSATGSSTARTALGPWIEAASDYTQHVVRDPRRLRPRRARAARGRVRALAAPRVLRAAARSSAWSSRSARYPYDEPDAARRAVQGVRQQLDGRSRAAQHRPRGAARRARARGVARRRVSNARAQRARRRRATA